MRHAFRRRTRPDDLGACALVCARALVDAGARPYVERHAASCVALPPSSAKVREAAALLRQLRGAWLGLGTQALELVSDREAREQLGSWRAPLPAAPDGEALLVTLFVRSTTSFLLEGTATDIEQARSDLEALSSVYIESVQAVELDVDKYCVRARDAFELLYAPRLCEAPPHAPTFCTSCGLWLGPVADDTDRCVDCATPLAA